MIVCIYGSPPEFRQNKKRSKRRIPPQTPPPPLATSKFKKRNQPKFCGILSPENCFRKTSSALFQISSSGLLSKKVRILYNEYRQFSKRVSECKMGSARSADTNEFPPPNPESKRVFHAPRGSSFANTKI